MKKGKERSVCTGKLWTKMVNANSDLILLEVPSCKVHLYNNFHLKPSKHKSFLEGQVKIIVKAKGDEGTYGSPDESQDT